MQKLSVALILVACLATLPFRGRAKRPTPSLKHVIVAQFAKLGDMVCTTPVFRAIKHFDPDIRITVLGHPLNREVLNGSSDVDAYLAYNGDFWQTMRHLRKMPCDAGIVATPDFIALALLFLGGARHIVAPKVTGGYSPYETIAYRLLRTLVDTRPHDLNAYAPREYLRLLESFGIVSADTSKHLAISNSARQSVASFFVRHSLDTDRDFIVGISPSAGNKIKNWFPERFAEVATYLCTEYRATVLVLGGSRDAEEVQKMMEKCGGNPRIINTLGVFLVEELKALIAQLGLLIGVDTGPMYIAEALNVPTIDIIGPVSEKVQPPFGEYHRLVYLHDRRTAELFIMNARAYDRREARRQIEEITTEMVIQEIDSLVPALISKH